VLVLKGSFIPVVPHFAPRGQGGTTWGPPRTPDDAAGAATAAHTHTGMTGSYSEQFESLVWLPGHNLAASGAGDQDTWNKIRLLLPSMKAYACLRD